MRLLKILLRERIQKKILNTYCNKQKLKACIQVSLKRESAVPTVSNWLIFLSMCILGQWLNYQ